ncbi:four helix bundle protein [Aeoliella sp. ICT_H6.2]|uniref:Four helix bundle protein n=1 Tax=Aeoliella straminimaris TaxID=2954799 RepID=A0A9X2FA50_9BACT|nr:four helix bundle protein [Aeoliella straminimaris]MCO6045215.1 four helix bundle protein [Aeoliella straminimaris]
MTDDASGQPAFDLEERTAKFGEEVIYFVRGIEANHISKPLITQLVRATGSVGANYCEADEASSKKEFRYHISLCKKEATESKQRLRLLVAACPNHREEARRLWSEANELTKVFAAIHRNSKPGDSE